MFENTYCVIMAGGVGSRFWPMSRSHRPKQFLDILGTGESLLQQTFARFEKICPKENILVVTHQDYKEQVQEQLPDITPSNILAEPSRRNTAPCIAYATYKISGLNPNANIIIAPSDHLILKEDDFVQTIKSALRATEKNNVLVTLGIKPSRPDTGYGYIQFTSAHLDGAEDVKKVKTFMEKPDLEMAKYFMDSGEFLWNSGMFIWNLQSIKEALEKYLPSVDAIFRDGEDKLNTEEEEAFIQRAYSMCTNISIDYGVMEKANNVYVVPAEFGWSDLGTWGSLYDNMDKDNQENAVTGNNVIIYDSKNTIVNMPKEKLVVLQGLDDYIVVESDDILLVCKKSEEQKIKAFVSDIKANKGSQFI